MSVMLLSGGIDSTTMLAQVSRRVRYYGAELHCLIFDYGQTLLREVELSRLNALHYGAVPHVIQTPLDWLGADCSILAGSETPIAKGRTLEAIKDGGTPTSYVPFRNGIFLAYAVAFAEAHQMPNIYCGGNGLYSGNYWDDTAEFAGAFQEAARVGTDPDFQPTIVFPWAGINKGSIVGWGVENGVDYSRTWSCYENGDTHCGECDSCKQRAKAFEHFNLDLEGRPL